MSRFLRRNRRDDDQTGCDERLDQISPDLAFELQSKLFDQLATVGVAGAGLAVTLIGSMLRNAPNHVWLAVALFVVAAVTAISGNQKLIAGLTQRQPSLGRSKRDVQIAMMLIGMAIGWLSMSVYAESAQKPSAVTGDDRPQTVMEAGR